MKRGGRALAESLVLHGLLFGAMIIMAGSLTLPPQTIRLDFCMLEPERPKSPAPVAASSPAPQSKPVAPADTPPPSQPKPVAVKPKPVTAAIKPAPPKPKEPAPEVAAAMPETAPVPSTSPAVTPPDPENSATPEQTTATAGSDAVPVGDNPPGQMSHSDAGAVEASAEYRHANFGNIRSSILGNLRYPMLARRQGWSGLVEVAFLVAPDGSVSDLRIQASSGFPVLDDQALAAVRRSAPFVPPRMAALLVVPVTFRLN